MCWDPLRRENKLIALEGERLLDLAWTVELATGDDRPISYALSQTNGRSFEPPRSTGLIGQTATPLHLGGGNVLVAYRRVDEPGLWVAQARVTADGGWVTGRQIPLWAAEGGGTAAAQADSELDALQAKTSGLAFGLPTMVRMASGAVMLAFWCEEEGLTNIRYLTLELGRSELLNAQ